MLKNDDARGFILIIDALFVKIGIQPQLLIVSIGHHGALMQYAVGQSAACDFIVSASAPFGHFSAHFMQRIHSVRLVRMANG